MNTLKLEGSPHNEMVRVLNNERLKYTVRVHLPTGNVIEWQADREPKLVWNNEARALWLCAGGYDGAPIMAWVDASALLVEENNKQT